MKHPFILTLVTLILMHLTLPISADVVLEPFTLHYDFENGSVGAWSSYPPSQDTAYDPTIWVKPLYKDKNVDNRALYREITPNYEIDYIFGVRKLLNIYVNGSSVLSFRCMVKSNRNIKGVKVRFGFEDGTDIEHEIPFTETLKWQKCSIRLNDIISLNSVKKLNAVAFMAICPVADPENLLRFGIDDISINGLRESQWIFDTPKVHKLDEWPEFIAGKHYKENDILIISGRAPFNAGSVAVIISRALTGESVKTYRMRLKDDEWSLSLKLSSGSGITSGMWRATIKASSRDKKDDTISTDLLFLVKRDEAPDKNPRLLLKPGDGPKILEKASTGRMQTIWNNLQRNAKRNRDNRNVNEFQYNLDAYDEKYWLPTYGGYIQAISAPTNYIRSNAVVYGISGDTEAGNAACNAFLMMSKWPSFVHPHILNQGQFTYWPVGQILGDLAVGYDMICDRFDTDDRRIAAKTLYEKGVTEIFKEYVRDNRVSSNTSNWIGDVTAGGILCALAVMDDYSSEELEPYFTGMLLKLNGLINNGFDNDGDYGEGFSYLAHAMHCVNTALQALDITFGIHFPKKLKNAYKFLLYQTDSSTKILYDFGDSTDLLGRMSNFTYLIKKYRDPYLKWLYDLSPGTSDVDLIMMDDNIPAQDPGNLPSVILFRDVGTAIFRSGFEHHDFMLVFRCGPFYNHQHFDQGSFHLCDRGEYFLTEMGKSDYYDDPWYRKLIIQAGGHNCILLDRNAESQRSGDLLHDVPAWNSHASISDFMTFEDGAFVSGKLDPLYKGKISILNRNILYCAPRTVILIDEASGPVDAREINLRFHTLHKEDISVDGKNASIKKPGATFTVHTVCPENYTPEILKRPLTTSEFGGEDAVTMKARGFIQLSTDLKPEVTTFVNVLTTDEHILASLDEQRYGDHAKVTVGNRTYLINTTGNNRYSDGEVSTDALIYTVQDDGFMAMRTTEVT
ncbi:MAG: heparinase II/III family protein, partial [Candidatus Latescibacteria bacterium]|nr:heparinase II/III family protein [Candidatus Latescibacterota bacterium]